MKPKKSNDPPNNPSNRLISRYTTLPFVLDIIERKRIVLLPPDSWADRSDALVLQKYKNSMGYTCLLALCLAKGSDTIHHWNTFANGPAGCRVIFKEEPLLNAVKKIKGVRTGDVEYIKIKDFARHSKCTTTWPFIKRWPYHCEEEFRMIYESTNARDSKKMELEISIEFEYIHSIMINQSVPPKVFKSIKEFIISKSNIHVGLSRIHENPAWLGKF
jgi:hypothetical protein